MMTNRNSILWEIKKQTRVDTFSTTAEIIAINDALAYPQSIRELYAEVFNIKRKIYLWEDNSSALSNVVAGETPKARHILIKCHTIFEAVEKNELLELRGVRSDEQIANLLTKALERESFQKLVARFLTIE